VEAFSPSVGFLIRQPYSYSRYEILVSFLKKIFASRKGAISHPENTVKAINFHRGWG